MILTRHSIQDLIDKKLLNFSPNLDKYQNQPHAVDLRLGTVFYISKTYLKKYDNNVIKVAEKLDIGKSTIYNMLKKKKEEPDSVVVRN